MQIIFAGKAHPADEPGKQLIQEVYRMVKKAENGGRLVFLEDYDMNLARYLVQGVDVWMNTPRRPNGGLRHLRHEGRPERRAQLLGAGWLVARSLQRPQRLGHRRGPRAWIPGDARTTRTPRACTTRWRTRSSRSTTTRDPTALPREWLAHVKESIRTITPQFSTRRMVKEYVERLYVPALPEGRQAP